MLTSHFLAKTCKMGLSGQVLARRRCLIPAGGFYDWRKTTKPKLGSLQVPHIRDADQGYTTVCRPNRGCEAQNEIRVNGKEQRRDR
jgi:hypothetical protein